MYLNNICKNKKYVIKELLADEITKRRLYDFGIISGSKISLIYINPTNSIKAYLIDNSLISIRNKDALLIEVYND